MNDIETLDEFIEQSKVKVRRIGQTPDGSVFRISLDNRVIKYPIMHGRFWEATPRNVLSHIHTVLELGMNESATGPSTYQDFLAWGAWEDLKTFKYFIDEAAKLGEFFGEWLSPFFYAQE